MLKRSSNYTKTNPWKMYPKGLACFCGSGFLSKYCQCVNLMPQWISPRDEVEAWKEMREIIAYIRTMRLRNVLFKDDERAAKFQRIFAERDSAHYNDLEMQKKGEQVRLDNLDQKQKIEFENRRIDLDEQIIGESINGSRVGSDGDSSTVDREGSVSDAADKLSKPDTEEGWSGEP